VCGGGAWVNSSKVPLRNRRPSSSAPTRTDTGFPTVDSVVGIGPQPVSLRLRGWRVGLGGRERRGRGSVPSVFRQRAGDVAEGAKLLLQRPAPGVPCALQVGEGDRFGGAFRGDRAA